MIHIATFRWHQRRRSFHHDLSSWQQDILKKKQSLHSSSKRRKLIQTLSDKTNYTVRCITQVVCQPRTESHKIHRVLQFHQDKWLKPYIQPNTMKRQEAENKFEESLY